METLELKKFLEEQDLDTFNPVIEFINHPVTLIDKIKEIVEKSYVNYFKYVSYDHSLKQFVCHVYAVNKTKQYGVRVQEVMREFETYPSIWRNAYYSSCGMNAGFHAIWNKKKFNAWYVDVLSDDAWDILPEWIYQKGVPIYSAQITTTEEIIANDISLQYFSYDAKSNVDLLRYIKAYRKYPIGEMLMKLKLYRFCTNEKALQQVTNNKAFRKWLFSHHEECYGLAYTTCFNAFKKNPTASARDYYNSLQYRIQCGKELAINRKETYSILLEHTNQEKLYDYLKENKIDISSYYDYIDACLFLRLNLDDTKVLFPHNFQEVHDDYTKQYQDYKNREETAACKEITDGMARVATKYGFVEFNDDNYQIITAKSKLDLIEESSVLGHCVGRMNYDQRQVEGKSLICFLRKNDALEMPYVTIELDLNDYHIRQAYGKNNQRVPEVEPFTTTWLKYIKKQLKEFKRTGMLI